MTEVEELTKALGRLKLENEEQQLTICQLRRHIKKLEDEAPQPAPVALPEMQGGEHVKEDAEKVQEAFRHFRKVYYLFKRAHGLPHSYDDKRDMALAFMDKAARVARVVKHDTRGDSLPDELELLERSLFGALAYSLVIGHAYDIPFTSGLVNELVDGVQQHGGKSLP